MRIILVVNDARFIQPSQTTAALGDELLKRGHSVGVAGVADFSLGEHGRVSARVLRAAPPPVGTGVAQLKTTESERWTVGHGDLVLLRTNPGRDPRAALHSTMLELMRVARDTGAVVLNDPDALARARSKLFLHILPAELRPRTLVTGDSELLRTFIGSCPQGAVLKPLDGTQGRDVFRVRSASADNLPQIIDLLTRSGPCMAQEFVPQAAAGDVRIILVDGAPLRVGRHVAAVRRVPGSEDFRSNVHVGGTPQRELPSAELLDVAHRAGAALRDAGIHICGLDVIGLKVIEVNVFSPGGLGDAGRFTGADFVGALVEKILGTV